VGQSHPGLCPLVDRGERQGFPGSTAAASCGGARLAFACGAKPSWPLPLGRSRGTPRVPRIDGRRFLRRDTPGVRLWGKAILAFAPLVDRGERQGLPGSTAAASCGGTRRSPRERSKADGVGFEPTSRFRDCRFSRPVHSTALPPVRLRPADDPPGRAVRKVYTVRGRPLTAVPLTPAAPFPNLAGLPQPTHERTPWAASATG
jgi:hypothetical protein